MKKLPQAAKLGMQYHIHDLIGADRLERSAMMQHGFVEKNDHICDFTMLYLVFSTFCQESGGG